VCIRCCGNVSTEQLPSDERGATDTDTQTDGKCAVEMGSGAMIYVPSFMKIGPGIQKLKGGGGTRRQHGDRISVLPFLQNKESRLKMKLRTD
jgi:hypothetical protein